MARAKFTLAAIVVFAACMQAACTSLIATRHTWTFVNSGTTMIRPPPGGTVCIEVRKSSDDVFLWRISIIHPIPEEKNPRQQATLQREIEHVAY